MARGRKKQYDANADIRKNGPQNYLELQAANASNFGGSALVGLESRRNTRPLDITDNPTGPMTSGVFKVNKTGEIEDYWGKSSYDEDRVSISDLENLGDIRANNQPWYAKVGAGLAKGAILAGTTFLDGTIGLVTGIGTAIGEGRWSGLWDNDFSKAMKSINDWSEEAMPNYYTKQELEGPWYENIFTANFLGDKFIKNLGFTVGAFYGGGLITKPIKAVGALAKAGVAAKRAEGLISAAQAAEKVKNISNATSMVSMGVGSTLSSVNEGRIEALNNSTDWYNSQKELIDQAYESGQLDDQQYEEALARANEDRLKMGNADLLMNVPILMASNIIQFGKLYANGMETAKKGLNIVGNAGNWASGSSKAGALWGITKGALSEGTEEISQSAASRIAGNYYATDVNNFVKAKTDPEASQETLSWAKAFADGINETVNDGSAWEEFFIGSLTGALGMPKFRGMKDSEGNWQSPVTIEEGAWNGWKQFREARAEENEVANYMNERFNSPEFKNYYQGLVRHNKYQNDMNKAAENDDPFEYHNAEHGQMISDVMMFDKAGKLGDLVSMINDAFDTSDENLESIVKNTTSTAEDGKTVGPFVDENGNPAYSTEKGKQQMIEQLTKNKDKILESVDDYVASREFVMQNLPKGAHLSDDQIDELTWMHSQINNWSDRAVEMSGEIKGALGKIVQDINADIAVQQSIRTQEGMKSADLTDAYKEAEKRIQELEQAKRTLEHVRNLDDETLASSLSNVSNADFVDNLKDNIFILPESSMDLESKKSLFQKLDDVKKLAHGKETFNNKFNEYITNPEQQAADHQQAEQEAIAEEQTRTRNSLVEALNAANDMKSFRSAVTNSELDQTDKDAVLQQMKDEGNPLAQDYADVESYNREVRQALALSNLDDQTFQDAAQLLKDQYEASSTLQEISNTNSVYVNNDAAFDEVSENAEEAKQRFNNAQLALQEAMNKVNNDNKFKNRFAEQRSAPAPTTPNPDPAKGTDSDTTGDSGTPTVPPVNMGAQVTEGYTPPVGNISSDMVSSENTQNNNASYESPEDYDNKHEGAKPYYRPAIPEFHIESSRLGDFRPFNVVVKERESGVNFDTIYKYLKDKGAFEYINSGKLKVSDEIEFMIDPAFEESVKGASWHTKPTIFMVTKEGQVVGSLDEGASTVNFEGLPGLEERVRAEYAKQQQESSEPKGSSENYQETIKALNEGGGIIIEPNITIRPNGDISIVFTEGYGELSQEVAKAFIADVFGVTSEELIRTLSDTKEKRGSITRTIKSGKTYTIGYTARLDNDGFVKIEKDLNTPQVGIGKEWLNKHNFTAEEAIPIKEHEYNDFKESPFISPTQKTKVSKIMVGKFPYGTEEKSLADIPNVRGADGTGTPIFGVIKNGTMSTNGAIDDNLVVKPMDMSQKEGRLYLLIPNGAGKYSPAAIRVKHFNNEEFNLEDATVADTPIGKDIIAGIEKMAETTNETDLKEAVKALNKDLYLGNLHIDWFETTDGGGIRFTKVERDSNGNEIYITDMEGKRKRQETVKTVYMTSKPDPNLVYVIGEDNVAKTPESATKDIDTIIKEITDILSSFNLPIQVSIDRLGTKGYANRLINSGILTSNIADARVQGTWFTTDYFDNEGNLQTAVNPEGPSPTNPQQNAKVQTPVGGKNSVVPGVPISINGKEIRVDLQNNLIYEDDKPRLIEKYKDQMIVDLAWAQSLHGNRTEGHNMHNNCIVTPSGQVLNRTTQQYLTGDEAQKIKDIIDGKNKTRRERQEKAQRVINSINESQKRVAKDRTDDENYYIQEEDGQYYPYTRVHSRLGGNWTESEKQKEALKYVQTKLSQLVDTVSQYDGHLAWLEKKYEVDLKDFRGKTDIKSRQMILSIIRDKMAGTNSVRALEAGSAVDTILRQYFITEDPSTITRPSNMSEEAFNNLMTRLQEIKSNMESQEMRFLTNNIVLYQKYPDGTRIAGEVDILAVDRDGNFRIYDVKTSKWPFGNFMRNGRQVNFFENKAPTQRMSTKAYYTLQLSAYKNLFESQFGVPITQLAIMPFVLSYEGNTVSEVKGEAGIPITYNPAVNVPLTRNVSSETQTGATTEPTTEASPMTTENLINFFEEELNKGIFLTNTLEEILNQGISKEQAVRLDNMLMQIIADGKYGKGTFYKHNKEEASALRKRITPILNSGSSSKPVSAGTRSTQEWSPENISKRIAIRSSWSGRGDESLFGDYKGVARVAIDPRNLTRSIGNNSTAQSNLNTLKAHHPDIEIRQIGGDEVNPIVYAEYNVIVDEKSDKGQRVSVIAQQGGSRNGARSITVDRPLNESEINALSTYLQNMTKVDETTTPKELAEVLNSANSSTPQVTQQRPSTSAQPRSSSPIFDPLAETHNPTNMVIPEAEFSAKGAQPGYYVLNNNVYKGYLLPVGEINGVEVYVTKVPNITKGFGKQEAHVASTSYVAVFPNGASVTVMPNVIVETEQQAIDKIRTALNGNPQRITEEAAKKTVLSKMEPAKVSGAAATVQVEQALKGESRRRPLKLREAKGTTVEKWDRKKEVEEIKKMLPQLSAEDRIRFVSGLIRVADRGALAWGQMQDGIITLSDVFAPGTAYHEAFHVVFNHLLDDSERAALLQEARGRFGKGLSEEALEEELAEEFRSFQMGEIVDTRSLGKKILDFFKNLLSKVRYWNNFRPSSMYYYQAIRKGNYANKTLKDVSVTRLNTEEYTDEMKTILANAPRNAQGQLLAPNGKVSNLTERQYAHVRTKAFKEWFGDWETLAYDNVDLDNIPNLNKINVAEFVNEVNKYLEKDFITREFLNREAVNIINQLFKNIKDVEIFSGDIKEQGLSFYSGKIVISNNIPLSDQAATFVHEIIHNFTTYSYDTNSEFRDEINKYHKRAYIYARKNNLPINSDVYEFMANILSPYTAETLMKIPSDNEKSNLLKDIISSFVKALRIFTNNEIIRGHRTLFHDVVEAIYNNQKDNKAFNNNVSKVVDENGEPLVVYHGTNIENINIFDRTKINENETLIGTGTAGFGNFFSNDENDASSFANITKLRRGYGTPTIYKCFLNIKNPLYFNTLGEFRDYSHKEGHYNDNGDFVSDIVLPKKYDGVIVKQRNAKDLSKEFVAPTSNQIKSATDNVGTYSKDNNDIRYRRTEETRVKAFNEVPQEERQFLTKKGWTAEHFNRISQEERDKALSCLSL